MKNCRINGDKLQLSSRFDWVARSEIRNMSVECERLKGINLSQGVVDTEVPRIVREGACEAINSGVNSYTRHDGIAKLRRAISEKEKKYTGLEYNPDEEIVVSSGATGALYCACLALLEPGDEVIVFEPYYGYHVSTLLAVEAVPRFVSLKPPRWNINEESLKSQFTDRTKAIIINTPANPSGKVFSKDELDLIYRITSDYNIFVFTDEIYEHFLYDENQHIAPATISGARERTITISGLSKTFSITGWRVGYSLCDKRWAKAIGYFNDLIYVCAPAPLQKGVADGLMMLDSKYYDELRKEYKGKRQMICEALHDVGLEPILPKGAYYVLADISRIPGANSKERAMNLLIETGVASVPGEAFYSDGGGKNLARFCFAKENNVLHEACDRLKRIKNIW